MLIEFSVENYKSFKERVTLSMIAASMVSENHELDENNTFKISDDLSLLKCAAIYGANASGKSNLIAAMNFMREFLLNPRENLQAFYRSNAGPFLLSLDTQSKPSFFEIVFLIDGKQYRYGFEVDSERVVSEWLFYVPKTREAKLFTRDEQGFSIGASFKEGRHLEDKTKPNALFLPVVAQFNGSISQQILEWIESLNINTGLQDHEFRQFTLQWLKDSQKKNKILSLLEAFDLGFEDIRTWQMSDDTFIVSDKTFPEDVHQAFISKFNQLIFTEHTIRGTDGSVIGSQLFDADKDESEGTRKLIALSAPLLNILENGTTWFIDEFDARLHPLITRKIVKLFNSKETNPKGAQLIFVTHDTNLLDKALLRRDQIWFIGKDRQGGSHLTALLEFNVRNDTAYEKNYLFGRYGGIPYLSYRDQLKEVIHG